LVTIAADSTTYTAISRVDRVVVSPRASSSRCVRVSRGASRRRASSAARGRTMMGFFSSRARALERPARREARSAATKARANAPRFLTGTARGCASRVDRARARAHRDARGATRAPRPRERRERVFARRTGRARARERASASDRRERCRG